MADVIATADGVFAVAITLLAFNLTVPAYATATSPPRSVVCGCKTPPTSVVSFLVIGIIWINHHAVLPVGTIPFATDLFAPYLRTRGEDGKVAAAIYSAIMTIMSVAFSALYRAVL